MLRTFIECVVRDGHLVIIGVPRCLLVLDEWQRLIELVTATVFSADLFIFFEKGNDVLYGRIPDLISQALRPLVFSNSYTLRKIATKITRQIEDKNLASADRQRQLSEILSLAAVLGARGIH